MFRPASLLRAAKAASFRYAAFTPASRFYASGASPSVESRVLDILRGFDKVDEGKLSLDAQFTNDLGLDSLDTVEVVMAIEEEFSVEIPDSDAEHITTARQAVDYISKRPDAH